MKKLTLAGCVIAAVGFVFADRVELKSGSYLTGTVSAVSTGEVTFKSDDLGEVKIKVGNIRKLDVGEHVVQLNDSTEEKRVLAIADGKIVCADKPLDMAEVKAIDPVAEKWHGNVAFAFSAARGNTYENSGSVIVNFNRRWEKDRLTADFGYYYSETGKSGGDTQKTTDRWEIEAKHDHFWWTKVYHYEDLKYERDVIQELDARYRVGLGGGYQWLENREFASTGKWNFNQEFGVNWVKEEYENNDDTKKYGFCALRYAHHFGWVPKWTTGLELFHNAEILPEVDQWDKLLVKCDVGFSTMLIWDFNLLAKIEWDFDSKPANNRRRDDIRYIVGLGYKW